jgi:phage/plasmid-like protein (TIGR03299 family)
MFKEREEIDYSDNSAPWENLSVTVDDTDTLKQMLKKAGADWKVDKVPELVIYKDRHIYTGRSSLIRSDTDAILSSVPNDWNEHQNEDALKFFQRYIREGSMSIENIGVLDEGRNVFVLAKLNEGFRLKHGKKLDDIDSYFLFSNPHRYGWSIAITPTQIRPVCMNALVQALKKAMFRYRHDTEFDPEEVHKLIAENRRLLKEYKEKAEFLSKVRADNDDTAEYFEKLYPFVGKNARQKERSRNAEVLLTRILDEQPGADLGAGTWWANFNAVTYGVDHVFGYNDNTRMETAFYGAGRDKKIEALDLAVKYAKQAA